MVIGRVKWFNDEKGFGFVAADNKDYFIHYKDMALKASKKATE